MKGEFFVRLIITTWRAVWIKLRALLTSAPDWGLTHRMLYSPTDIPRYLLYRTVFLNRWSASWVDLTFIFWSRIAISLSFFVLFYFHIRVKRKWQKGYLPSVCILLNQNVWRNFGEGVRRTVEVERDGGPRHQKCCGVKGSSVPEKSRKEGVRGTRKVKKGGGPRYQKG
jgi:hypothetical protein